MKILKKAFAALKRALEFVLRGIAIVIYMLPVIYIGAPLLLVAFTVEPVIGYTLLAALAVFFVVRYTVLLCRRASFLRALKRHCDQHGYAVRKTGKPLLSAWLPVRGGAEIKVGDKTHTLFFVACRKRRVPVTLHEDGTVIFHHAIRIGLTMMRRTRGGNTVMPVKATLFSWDHHWRFADEIPPNSFVLLAPAPNTVSGIAGGIRISVDNGVAVGNYAVYTCGAFLRGFSSRMDT